MRLLAGSLSFFPHGPLPHGNWFPPEQAIQEITRSCNVFYKLALEVTRHLFYISSQSHRPDIFSVGENTRCVSMRWDHWGPCWSLLFSIVLILCTHRIIYLFQMFVFGLLPIVDECGFPDGAVVKNPHASVGDAWILGSISGLGRSTGVGMATCSSLLT